MKKRIYLLVLPLIILAVSGCTHVIKTNTQPEQPAVQEAVSQQAKTFVDFGDGQPVRKFEAKLYGAETAYDLLVATGLTLGVKEYSFGNLVESIDGVKGGEGDKFWIYYINDEAALVSADTLHVETGDKVLWRFETENSEL